MAIEVIDLTSSSPRPAAKKAPEPPLARDPPTPSQAASRLKRHATAQIEAADDDEPKSPLFLDLCEVDELPDLAARGPKRRRISDSQPPGGLACSHPPFGLPAGPRPSRPSECSGSVIMESSSKVIALLSSSPSNNDGASARLTPTHAHPPCLNAGLARKSSLPAQESISADPFASSPIAFRPGRQRDLIDDSCTSDGPQAPSSRSLREFDPISTHIDSSDPLASSPINTTTKIHHGNASRIHWDPISSSAPERLTQRPPSPSPRREEIDLRSDGDYAFDSDDEFPDIGDVRLSRAFSASWTAQDENIPTETKKKSAAPKKSVEQRTRDREARAAAKALDNERKKREREEAQAAKRQEKARAAALAEVNKVRTDKKVSTSEMIVLIPIDIDDGLKVQAKALLNELEVQCSDSDSPAGTTFKWRRKVSSRFDEELGRWEPSPLRIKPESHALTILSAEEMVELTMRGDLHTSIQQTKDQFPGHTMIYIIQGMNAWVRRNRNIRNRQFASVVRQGADAAGSQSRRRNGKAASEEYVSEDIVEDALLRMQVEHQLLIHHTETQLDTAQWIVRFTQHISTIPYKKQRDEATSSAGFCMESGQVRTGEDARDTYVKLLQEIVRVTAPIAHGIAAEFDSVSKLVKGLERGGPTALEDLRKSTNRDGGFSDRAIGQAVSRRIHKVFTGLDESSTDI